MPHLIYRNPQSEIHTITIRAVDNGAPLVNGAIYEVSDVVAADLLATEQWRKVEPVKQAEGENA